MIYVDTHVAVWLYAGQTERIPVAARALLETDAILVSPAAVLELQFLHEIKKITCEASVIVESLQATIGLSVCSLPFHSVIVEALLLDWTRDPFDRVIVAQAKAAKARLLTKDKIILSRFAGAVWDRT